MFGYFQPPSLGFQLHLPFSTRGLLFQFLIFSTIVRAAVNITVDDTDQTLIRYSPGDAWQKSAQSSLDYGGTHMLTNDPNAIAVFQFTGTAIYFLSPLWPYQVSTVVSLDSSPPTVLSLVDPSRNSSVNGEETVPYHVVWSATDLPNTQHTLTMSFSSGFAIVDGLIYTSSSNSSSTPSSPAVSTATSSVLPPTTIVVVPPTTSSPSSGGPVNTKTSGIIVGVVVGVVVVVAVGIVAFYYGRRSGERNVDSRVPSSYSQGQSDGLPDK